MTAFITRDQTRHLSQAAQLEETTNPAIVRAALIATSLGILGFIAWSSVTRIDEVARTAGEIVPQGYQQLVQHLEGGIVRKIDIEEGAIVDKGQTLLQLDGAGAQEDLDRALKKQASLSLQEERYRAFSENRDPDFKQFTARDTSELKDQTLFFNGMVTARNEERKVLEEQLGQKHHMIDMLKNELKTAQSGADIARDLFERRKKLNTQGFTSDVQFLEAKERLNTADGAVKQLVAQIAAASGEAREFDNRLASLDARYHGDTYQKLDDIHNEMAQNTEMISKLQARVARLDIRAPARGIIKGLAVNTVGEVVQPGQTLMEIVPLDGNLVAEVRIPPQNIGHLKEGQSVHVKFSSYDFSRYGFVDGVLDQISATTFAGDRGERFYRGRIRLVETHVGREKSNTIMPGMTVMADIVTGRKTILQYLIKPVNNAMKTAFSER